MHRYILDVLLINPRHPFGWYMQFLLIWYIIFYFVYRIKYLSKYKEVVFLFFSIILLFMPNELWAEQAFSFVFGLLVSSKIKDQLGEKKIFIAFTLIIFGTACLLMKQFSYVQDLPKQLIYWIQLLYKFSYAVGLILLSYKIRYFYKSDFFVYLGSISYEIYLVHGYTYRFLEIMSYMNICLFLFSSFISAFILNILSNRSSIFLKRLNIF